MVGGSISAANLQIIKSSAFEPADFQDMHHEMAPFHRYSMRETGSRDRFWKRAVGGVSGRVFGNRLETKVECPQILSLFYIILNFVADKDKSPDTRQTDEQDGWKEVAHFN